MVGISERTFYREKICGAHFKAQLRKDRESVADLCFRTLTAAAEEKWRAANQL